MGSEYINIDGSLPKTTTGSGAEVHANSPTLTNPTFTGTLSTSAGAIGQVLADSDGAGLTYWQNPNAAQPGVAFLGLAGSSALRFTSSVNGSVLSAARPAYVAMDASTAGQLVNFSQASDVTIPLTGADWGLDSYGNVTDQILRAYAINDAGTLRWGVSMQGGLRSITAGPRSSTATANITSASAMLVNSSLTGTSHCMEVGWFMANFTDSDDSWAIQTTVGKTKVGRPAPVNSDWVAVIPTGTKVANATYTGWERRSGDYLEAIYQVAFAGATDGGVMAFNLPNSKRIDTSKIPLPADASFRTIGFGSLLDNGTQVYAARVTASTGSFPNSILLYLADDVAGGVGVAGGVSDTAPFTVGANDSFLVKFSVPILGWSGNDN